MEEMCMTAAEVAATLALSIDHFRRNRPKLEAAGFPRMLPGMSGRWSAAQVMAWIETGGRATAAAEAPADLVAAQRAFLEAKYAGRRA